MESFLETYWHQIWGIGLAVLGIYFAFRRNLPVGIQGGPTLFRLTGASAIVVSLLIALVGVAVATGIF
ncbi:hypothetical protein ACHAC9_24205 [Massilia sp. CMS3.1]|uniref:hypothetical protein n=1 Tax=Massilia sp. CMS3.1 TaxID=3373083 RepID=UPI003EE4D8D3